MQMTTGRLRGKRRRILHTQQVAPCTGVRHHASMGALRPHTKDYPTDARERLGLAVQRAREAADFPFRPAFAEATGIGMTSLVKLERGKPVGPLVYETVARQLPDWTEDTPRVILEGGPIPDPAPRATKETEVPDTREMSEARRRLVQMSNTELALRIAEVAEVQGGEAAGELLERILAIRAEARQRT